MRLSQLFTKTSKETDTDAVSRNADLLTRGGFIHKTMGGAYSFLPLGTRVLWKIEQILREEMDQIGNEVFLPSICPTELWEKTGRLDSVSVLFQATPANPLSAKVNDARYVLNSTHEEVITPLMQRFVGSYKDLPTAAYQIQTKFRNEPRPKSGLLRCREFRMKDLYSFHVSEDDMLEYFHTKAKPAYQRFYERVGLGDRTVIASASGGDFSKQPSLEFQTLCDTGEDHLFRIPGTDTYINREIAPSQAPSWNNAQEKEQPRKDVEGKGIIGVEELAAYLKIEVDRTTKTLLFECDDGRVIAAAVRGNYEVNEDKLRKIVGCKSMALASATVVKKVTNAEVGYAGPLGLPKNVEVIWDESTKGRKNFECGANETNMHSINVNFGRDLPEPSAFHDIKVAREGDLHPETGKVYEVHRACEVGNIFTLYTKFSDAFGFTFRDEKDAEKPVYMGCYGIGTSRVMGVLAEVSYDKYGLVWPAAVAPARVHIVPLAKKGSDPLRPEGLTPFSHDEIMREAFALYAALQAKGVPCLLDDRLDQSVGSRLADSDLIGCPTRIIVSPKSLAKKEVECKDRKTGAITMLPLAQSHSLV